MRNLASSVRGVEITQPRVNLFYHPCMCDDDVIQTRRIATKIDMAAAHGISRNVIPLCAGAEKDAKFSCTCEWHEKNKAIYLRARHNSSKIHEILARLYDLQQQFQPKLCSNPSNPFLQSAYRFPSQPIPFRNTAF